MHLLAACEHLSERVGCSSRSPWQRVGAVCRSREAASRPAAETDGFLSLRLDFNGFYTERLEHMSAERSQRTAPLLPRLAVPAQ